MLFDKIQGTEKYAGQSKPAAATIFHFLTPLQMRKLSFGVVRSPSPGSTASTEQIGLTSQSQASPLTSRIYSAVPQLPRKSLVRGYKQMSVKSC